MSSSTQFETNQHLRLCRKSGVVFNKIILIVAIVSATILFLPSAASAEDDPADVPINSLDGDSPEVHDEPEGEDWQPPEGFEREMVEKTSDVGANADIFVRYQDVGRCVAMDGQRFCTDVGFIGSVKDTNWKDALRTVLESRTSSDSGDKDFVDLIAELERLSARELNQRLVAQVASARQSTWKLDENSASGDPNLPEARATALAAAYPSSKYIIYSYYVEQETSYYCGVATMVSIDWADDNGRESQAFWAGKLGTTTNGTALSSIVSTINRYTNWPDKAGNYIVGSVSGWSQSRFVNRHRTTIGLYEAPIVEHVMLKKAYYNYLAKDHGGHFQTGRGYNHSTTKIGIFEPYDERDWSSNGNYTGKRQYVQYADLYNATMAHPHKTIGY